MVLVTFRDKIVFTDQSGQFWNNLDVVGINPNLRGGLWNLPNHLLQQKTKQKIPKPKPS